MAARYGTAKQVVAKLLRGRFKLANRFWLGKVNLPVAVARRQVSVEGRIGALFKLVTLARSLFPAYRELLTHDGRRDLLED